MSRIHSQLLQKALAIHQQGQLAAAIQQYNAVLVMDPGNFDALQLKGLALYQSGDPATAVDLLTRALKRNSSMPAVFNNRGLALQALGRRAEALADFSKAVALNAGYAEAICNRGNVLRELGRLAEAKAACEAALRLNPRVPQFHNSLGVVLKEEGNLAAALEAFGTASRLQPGYPDAIVNRATTLAALRRFDEALEAYGRALGLRPDQAEIHSNRALALAELGRFDEALAAFDRAIALKPAYAEAHSNRGVLLVRMMRLEEAVAGCERAIALRPDYAEAHLNRGNALKARGQLDPARESYDCALALRPGLFEAHVNRAAVLREQGRYAEALADCDAGIALMPADAEVRYVRAMVLREMLREADATAATADYFRLAASRSGAPEDFVADWAALLATDAMPGIYESEEQLAATRARIDETLARLAERHGSPVPLSPARQSVAALGLSHLTGFYLAYHQENDRETMRHLSAAAAALSGAVPQAIERPRGGGPIRLGIASQRLRNHNGANWAYNWLDRLPKGDYRIFTYNFEGVADDMSGSFASLGTHCQMVFDAASQPAILQRMRGDRLDALMLPDVGMTPLSRFLSLHRLAPVQFTAWGHPVTSGSAQMDYYLSSDLMEPADAQDHYTEKLVRLPNLALCLDRLVRPHGGEKEFGLPEGRIRYGCLQSVYKYLPRYDHIYPEIARLVPDALFVFLEASSSFMTEVMRRRLAQAFAREGLDAARHVLFLPRQGEADYDSLMRQMHVNIDSLGWSGGNTSLKSIGYGVPLLTMAGRFMRGRHSAAMFTMMGLDELTAATTEDYVAKLAELGRDEAARRHVSDQFRSRGEMLVNDHSVVTALDAFLKQNCA